MHDVVLAIAISLLAQEAANVRPDVAPDAEYLRYEEGFKPERAGSYFQIMISAPIGLDEWSRYCDMMILSAEQREALSGPYDRYRRTDWAMRQRQAQPLWDRSAGISALRNMTTNVATAESLRDLYTEAHKLEPMIDALENTLFAEVQVLLAEPQVALVDIVRLRRQRSRDQEARSGFPAYTFDIDDTLVTMARAGIDLTPVDRHVFEGVMAAWRQGATTMHHRLAELQRELIDERICFPARLNEMVSSEGATPEAYAFAEQSRRLGEPAAKAARNLLEFNRQCVDLLSAELPPAAAEHLRSSFDQAAYPAIFPDPASLLVVFNAINQLPLSAEQRAALIDIRLDCETTNAAVLAHMKHEYLDWKERTCARSGYVADEYRSYANRMQQFQLARIEECNTAILALESILTPAQIEAIRGEYELWRGRLDSFEVKRQAAIERHGGWPGPYD